MDIAVPDVPVGERQGLGITLLQIAQGLVDEDGELRDRHRNVRAQIAAAASLRLDHRLAIEPEALGLRSALSDDAVGD